MYMGGALTGRRRGGGGTCWAVPFIYWLFTLSEWAESEARHLQLLSFCFHWNLRPVNLMIPLHDAVIAQVDQRMCW
jgi:hypothetical protein